MRILHLPVNPAGAASGLADGQRRLGHTADVLCTEKPNFGFSADRVVDIGAKGRLYRVAKSVGLMMDVRAKYDIYNFMLGASLLHFPRLGLMHLDLPFLGAGAVKTFTYVGCDARQKYPTMRRNDEIGNPHAACFSDACYGGSCNSGKRDSVRRREIEVAAKYADWIFALNPDLLYFLPPEKSSFLPYAIEDFEGLVPSDADARSSEAPLRIVHAPTDRPAKGTAHLLPAIERLRETHPGKFEFSVVEGVDHFEARRRIREADVFVDQLLIGWYGGAALEAMKMGVPTVAYINDRHCDFVDPAMIAELPIIKADPGDIFDVLSGLIRERERLADISARSRAYAENWHDPVRVAEKFLSHLPPSRH